MLTSNHDNKKQNNQTFAKGLVFKFVISCFFLVLNGSHCQKLKQDKKIYRNENVASLGLLCEIWHKIGKLQHRKDDSHET